MKGIRWFENPALDHELIFADICQQIYLTRLICAHNVLVRAMSGAASTESETAQAVEQPAIWQTASRENFVGLDIDLIVSDVISADAGDYANKLTAALGDASTPIEFVPALEMLREIMRMSSSSDPDRPPFRPMFQLADGSRSAAPDDFRGPLVELIVDCLQSTSHPVPRARLAHLAWFLERRRREIGLVALDAYIRILEMLDTGELTAHGEADALSISGRDLLAEAFVVSRGLGRPEDQHERLVSISYNLLRRACTRREDWAVLRFGELALDRAGIPPSYVAEEIEQYIDRLSDISEIDSAADLWQLAGHAYRRAKKHIEADACQTQMAESYVRRAEVFARKEGGVLLAAHWMAMAVSSYHGVTAAKERRSAIRHRLVDLQEGIRDELVSVSHDINVSESIKIAKEHFSGNDLPTALKRFTIVHRPPDPEKLVEEARKEIARYPLSAMFSQSYLDLDGKTVANSPGVGFASDAGAAELEAQIARSEGIRRGFAVSSKIEIGRMTISIEHRVSDEELFRILRWSPSIPARLVHTACSGFSRYFEGDMVGAIYILTPMLEGILRKILKDHGYDVSTFDNATGTQEDRTITALYDALRAEMDSILGRALTEDIRRVFLSKLGPSLRHGVAHALISDGTPYGEDANYACWLIWHLVALPLLPHWADISA